MIQKKSKIIYKLTNSSSFSCFLKLWPCVTLPLLCKINFLKTIDLLHSKYFLKMIRWGDGIWPPITFQAKRFEPKQTSTIANPTTWLAISLKFEENKKCILQDIFHFLDKNGRWTHLIKLMVLSIWSILQGDNWKSSKSSHLL